MHGTSAGTPVPVTTFGGLVTLAPSVALPEGASPRTYDTDFLVGLVKTRPGLVNPYTYAPGNALGPNAGASASQVPNGGAVWSNISNVLTNTGSYATATVNAAQTQTYTSGVGSNFAGGTAWINPQNITSVSQTASVNIPTPSGNSSVLLVQQLGISLPSTAIITGISVSFSIGSYLTPNAAVSLFIDGALTISQNQALVEGTNTYTFGNSAYRWGTTLTPAILANMGFGAALSINGEGSVTANSFSMTVYYMVPNTGGINITGFGFSIPGVNRPQGFQVTAIIYGSAGTSWTLSAQLLKAGVAIGTPQSIFNSFGASGPITVNLGGPNNLFGAEWLNSDVNNTQFGVQITASSTSSVTVSVGYVTLTTYVLPAAANFDFITPFTAQNGDIKNLSLDANGNLWVEDVTNNPGVLNLALDNLTPNSYAVGVNGPSVEYLAINNLFTGSDMPLQYTPNWIDRITQVGPGAAPIFTPTSAGDTDYPIVNITQPSPNPYGSSFAHGLQSQGPGSNTAGTVVTIYYADATTTSGDPDLIKAFNSGYAVYLYATYTPSSGGDTTGALVTPANFLVTSIGTAVPPNNSRQFYYFTYSVATPQYVWNPGQEGFTVHYNRTLATLTTTVPVPGVTFGSQITVSGNSVSAWNTNWIVSQTPNASDMAITQSSLTAGVATFSYATVNGTSAPLAGQLVTITGTLNAGGQLNVAGWPIASVSGGATGTFTVSGFSAVTNYASEPEAGQASTAGTIFTFDPGIGVQGTTTDPIYGTGTGGNLVFNPTGLFVDPGTYQGTVFFITRNGYYTAPAPPVTFSVPENTTSLTVSNIPIGPPNVVARGIAITEAGQNGVPGANFFTLPTAVVFYNLDVKYTATSFFLNDNVSTTLNLFYSLGDIVDESLAIDVYAYNLFNQIEIGDPGWIVNYDSRNFYGLCRNKVQNFNNLSFDGGYLPATTLIPLGWTTPDPYGSLVISPKFGDAYYIQNTSGNNPLAVGGLISQSAYQDAYLQPIIQPNTAYSVRLTARIPSGNTTGSLLIALVANGITYGSYTLSFSGMTTSFSIYSGTLLVNEFSTVPTALQITVSAIGMGINADVEIDRIDVFPTAIPILTTTVYGSYSGLPEQVDAVTGQVQFVSENQQPVNGAVVMYDTFYALKGWTGNNPGSSMYSLQSSANLEPAQWNEPEVAQKSGAVGPMAFDFGKQWIVMAHRNGLDFFEGGQPGKIIHEIFQVWDSINWAAGQTIWVKNDETRKRLLIGVPLPTPNKWLPNAAVNANPATPNVILMCNYQGLDSGEAIKASPQMHTTMFGTLTAIDMRRKWSIWQIPSPFANVIASSTDEQIAICNGSANSLIYNLDNDSQTDNGAVIDSLYTTAGLLSLGKKTEMPALGMGRARTGFMYAYLESSGLINVRFLPNILPFPEPTQSEGYLTWEVPGGFAPGSPALNDCKCSVNFAAYRTFVEFRENDGFAFSLSNLTLHMKKDVWNSNTGQKTL